MIERPDAFAMPGLIDAHGHMEALGAGQEELDLRGVASVDEVARRVEARIEATDGDSWITGRNWDQSLWPGGAFPTAAALDAASPRRPVWLERVDGHAGWANTEAMRRAKVTKNSKAPSDGQILRDSDGKPTGVFVDGAMSLVGRAVPGPALKDVKRRLLAAQKHTLQNGLTGVHDAGISTLVEEAYRELDREGQLVIRIYAMASPPAGGEIAFVSRRPRKSAAQSRFELRAIKLFMDGAMGSRGALLFKPYNDDPGNSGLMLIDPAVLEATVTAAAREWMASLHTRDRGQGKCPGARRLCRRAQGVSPGARPAAADRACPGCAA